MLWRTSSLLPFLVCYFHRVSAVFDASTLEEALYANSEPEIYCDQPTNNTLFRIEDCYGALEMIARNVNESKCELIRNVPHRELRNPSRMDRVLGQGRFRLPAEINYESCVIRVTVHRSVVDNELLAEEARVTISKDEYNSLDQPQPEIHVLQLPTKQYFHIWEIFVPYTTTEVLERCVEHGSQGWAISESTIKQTRRVDFVVDVFPLSG
jgi:hypothetical protein